MRKPYGILVLFVLCAARFANGQQTSAPPPPSSQDAQPTTAPEAEQPHESAPDTGKVGDRIFGVLPNYTTVEGTKRIAPVSSKQMFHMAAEDAFDKPVFPFVAFTTWLAQEEGEEASWGRGFRPYAKRYATTFSDDVIATFMTTAVMPTLLHQDPRYFVLGAGGAWHRAAYAATRSFVTLDHAGHRQFNYSDVAGNAIAATAANLYHPVEDRSGSATTTRWGTQMMWDVLSDELKEFWPTIRHDILRR
jgi:hypothetical protein